MNISKFDFETLRDIFGSLEELAEDVEAAECLSKYRKGFQEVNRLLTKVAEGNGQATGTSWNGKPILCLDFDGVCNSYTSGWQGVDVINDEPVEGLFEFIIGAHNYFDIQVYSSRSHWTAGLEAMKVWFNLHWNMWLGNFPSHMQPLVNPYIAYYLTFPDHKPPAVVALDDRVLTFRGEWPDMDQLVNFQPWTKGKDNLTGYHKLMEDN